MYEREKRLRTMMSMHGLTDGPYWLVAYAYFLLLSLTFVIIFLASGAAFGKSATPDRVAALLV